MPVLDGNKPLDARMAAVTLGHDLYKKLKPLADKGWAPDAVLIHASKGASYFIRELFPHARITTFLEWYYRDPTVEDLTDPAAFYRLCANNAARNSVIMRDFAQADAAYAPTVFQKSRFPERWQPDIDALHEGIDTALYCPDAAAELTVGDQIFNRDMEIITYAARGMEKSRGFPQFMQAIARVQKERPHVQALIAAADRICYDPGGRGKAGLKAWADKHVDYDPARTHFVGLLPEQEFAKMLQVSSLHAYLSIPFVLSWSCLNAMSAGVPVLGADNRPVQEVIQDGDNGFLVDPDDVNAIADRMLELLEDRQALARVGACARESMLQRFELGDCVRQQLALING